MSSYVVVFVGDGLWSVVVVRSYFLLGLVNALSAIVTVMHTGDALIRFRRTLLRRPLFYTCSSVKRSKLLRLFQCGAWCDIR